MSKPEANPSGPDPWATKPIGSLHSQSVSSGVNLFSFTNFLENFQPRAILASFEAPFSGLYACFSLRF